MSITPDGPEPVVGLTDPIPAPIDRIPTPNATPPDIVRCAYMEIVVTDLEASRNFYVNVLDLVVTEEDENTVYLRSFEEFIHHNLVLRKGPIAAVAAFSYRVRTPEDLDRAVAFYTELGCRVERRAEGFTKGVGDSVRVEDPLGFPYEFFYDVEHVERLAWRYDLYTPGALVRLDHFNQVTPDVPRAVKYMEDLGFRVTEDIQDEAGTTYAAWMRRKPTVHDTAMTGGDGPRMHHVAFATHEKHNIIAICDKLGALRMSDVIERGPGRHGVSNAFYLYVRDPDGHRVEIYTQDYYTGDPDNPVVTWDVHDNQRRDWWGNPVVPSWYTSTATRSRSPRAPTTPRWRSPSAPTASRTPARTTSPRGSSSERRSDATASPASGHAPEAGRWRLRWISYERCAGVAPCTIGRSAMNRSMRYASSSGSLKLIACAAPSSRTITTWSSVSATSSRTRSGSGISGSRSPITTRVGMVSSSNRSRDG